MQKFKRYLKITCYLILGALISSFFATAMTMGAGGYPGRFFLLFATYPVIVTFIVWLLLKKRSYLKRWTISGIFLILVVSQGFVFGFLADRNIEKAKIFSETVIEEIDKYHSLNNNYPNSFEFLSPDDLNKKESLVSWPYIDRISDDTYRMGMLFIEFDFGQNPTEIYISRRDIRFHWNWGSNTWIGE
jgi:glucan phosphoethanolaminetransferase (alkaline phosphatase superfamily)